MAQKKSPRHKGAIKAQRQSERRNLRNRAAKKALRLATRAAFEAAVSKDQAKVAEKLPQAMSLLDKAAQRGTLHWRTAAREKSRLAARVQKALTAAGAAAAPAAAAPKP